MAYHIDEQTGELIMDGFEQGIANSPYTGIANMVGVNNQYYPGVAYVNYRRQAATLTEANVNDWYAGTHSTNVSNNLGWTFSTSVSNMDNPVGNATSPAGLNYILDNSGQVWKQTAVNSSTFNLIGNAGGRFTTGNAGIAYWNNYIVIFGKGVIEFCGDGTGDSTIDESHWNYINNGGSNTNVPFAVSTSPSEITITQATNPGAAQIKKNDEIVFSTAGILPSPLSINTVYYVTSISLSGAVYIMQVSTTVGGSNIVFTDTGTGSSTLTDQTTCLPIGNSTNLQFSYTPPPNSVTSITLVSYTSPTGASIGDIWQGATGTYAVIDPWGDVCLAAFTNGSATINFILPLEYLPVGTYNVQLLNPTVTNYRPYVSKVDGNLYFANGRYVGRILSENTNTVFNPSAVATYTVDYGAFSILQPQDTVTDITDLNDTLIVAGQKDLYSWNYVSPSTSAPIPVGSSIKRIVNLLNNIYIFSGQKGNMYVSNGSYAQFLKKIPDYIAGVIDPVWTFGGIMIHRSKIFFQAMAQDTSGNNLIQGIFSLIVSPSLLGETSNGIVVENRNSNGLVPATGSTGAGVLMNNEPSSNGQDSYYSVYSAGTSTGIIDYNDTTLWQNNEAFIETDIVPLGSVLDKKTVGQIMFKLDRPMATGDSITLYARSSLSDSYTLLGTTNNGVISDYQKTNIWEQQWMQFKVTFACASSNSSFIPLRELRIQLQ